MRAAQWIASAVFLAPLAGCILVAPGFEPAEHCPVAGASQCAKCITDKCQVAVDRCCGSNDCRSGPANLDIGATMNAVDSCGRGSTTCANDLESATPSVQGNGVTLCIEANCHSECTPNIAKGRQWSCASPSFGAIPCAECVTASCQGEVNTCCGDPSCSNDASLVKDMSSCLGGDPTDCDLIVNESRSGSAGAIRTCIAKKCQAQCLEQQTLTHRLCELDDGSCTCRAFQISTSDTCTTSSYGDVAECHEYSSGMGTKNDQCVCGHWNCYQDLDHHSCTCDFNSPAVDETLQTCNLSDLRASYPETSTPDAKCCLTLVGEQITCTCGLFQSFCATGTEEVASCDHDTIAGKLDTGVTACSR